MVQSGYANMNIRGKTGNVSEESAITEEELYKLLNEAKGKDKILVAAFGFYGLRESELIHARKNWIHINDSASRYLGNNHIQVPITGVKCGCSDCLLREYRKIRAQEEPDKNKRTLEFYKKVQKKFYRLKASGKIKQVLIKKLHEEPLWKPKWRPKSDKGKGAIPTIEPMAEQILIDYFNEHKKIGLNRVQIWTRIRKIGLKVLGREDLYPHALRASFLTLLAQKGITGISLQTAGRWSSLAPANHYLHPNEKVMFREIKEITNRTIL